MSRRDLSRAEARHHRDHSPLHSSSTSSSSHLTRFEDKVASQQRELQTLLIDNQRLGATHVALRQELSHSQIEIEKLKAVAARVKAERDAEVREVYERKLRVESEARGVEVMMEDLGRVRVDVERMSVRRKEMVLELKRIESEVLDGRLKLERMREGRKDVENMRQEVQQAKAAVENEKKTRASNQEHAKIMEKNMITVGREIERMRAALKGAEKKAVELNKPVVAGNTGMDNGYAAKYSDPEMRYEGGSHTFNMPRLEGTAEVTQYIADPVTQEPHTERFSLQPHGPNNAHQVNAPR